MMIPLSSEHGVTVLRLRPRYDSLDEVVLSELDETLSRAVAQEDAPRILLDLSQTEYIASRFIEILLRIYRQIADQQGRIALCEAKPFCSEVLRTMRLDSLWPIYPRRDQALETLAKL